MQMQIARKHSRNRVAIANTATDVPLTVQGGTTLIPGQIVRLRLRNENGSETIHVQLNGTGAATASQKDHVVLGPTSGTEHTRDLEGLDTGRRTLSAISTGLGANLTWEAFYND